MARIPRIETPARTITAQTPGRRIRKTSTTGDVLQVLGQAGKEIGDRLQITNTIAEKTRAQNDRDAALLDIRSRANLDPDTSQSKQKSYDDEIKKSIRSAGKLITIERERARFQLESESKANVARAKIQGSFRTKIIDQGKIDLESYLETKEKEFLESPTLNDKQTAILERDTKIREAVEAGYLTPAEGTERVNELNKDWQKSQLDYDISVNPELAAENILAGNYDLTAKEEKAALTLAQDLAKKRKKEADRQSEAAMQQNEVDMYNGVVSGEKSLVEINDAEARGSIGLPGGIRESVAADLRRLVTKGNTATAEEKANSFVELQDRFTDIGFAEELDLDKLAQLRSDVIDAMAQGKVRQTTGEKWLKDISTVMNEGLSEEVEKNNPRAGWGALKFWVDGLDPEEKQQMKERLGTELLERVSGGEDDTEAANRIIEKTQKDINPNRAQYKVNDIINTPSGNVRVTGFDIDGEPLVELVQ